MSRSWSPRRELTARLPRLFREICYNVRLLFRALWLICFGDEQAQNLALDRLLLREEGAER